VTLLGRTAIPEFDRHPEIFSSTRKAAQSAGKPSS
jgi:hypothetical protein